MDAIDRAIELVRGGLNYYARLLFEATGMVELNQALLREISSLVNAYISALFGITVMLLIVVGYISGRISCMLFSYFDLDDRLEYAAAPIKVSCLAASLFLICHVISYSTNASA